MVNPTWFTHTYEYAPSEGKLMVVGSDNPLFPLAFTDKKKIFFYSPPKREASRAQQQTIPVRDKDYLFPFPSVSPFQTWKREKSISPPPSFLFSQSSPPPPGETTVSAISHKSSAIKKGGKRKCNNDREKKGRRVVGAFYLLSSH